MWKKEQIEKIMNDVSTRLDFKEALKPICAVCRKEVERMEMLRETWHPKGVNIAVVYCHGKRRECRILNTHFYTMGLQRGIAFLDELDKSKIEGTVQEIQRLFITEQKKID